VIARSRLFGALDHQRRDLHPIKLSSVPTSKDAARESRVAAVDVVQIHWVIRA
jgi:hypothetical protein